MKQLFRDKRRVKRYNIREGSGKTPQAMNSDRALPPRRLPRLRRITHRMCALRISEYPLPAGSLHSLLQLALTSSAVPFSGRRSRGAVFYVKAASATNAAMLTSLSPTYIVVIRCIGFIKILFLVNIFIITSVLIAKIFAETLRQSGGLAAQMPRKTRPCENHLTSGGSSVYYYM